MNELDLLVDIKKKTEFLPYQLKSSHEKIQKSAQETFKELFKIFRSATEDHFTPQKLKEAEKECEHFLVLIDLAIAYHKSKNLKWPRKKESHQVET